MTPAKACPNDCGTSTRGVCEYFSPSTSAALNSTECPADSSAATCWASCTCLDGYGGDGCQYTLEELDVAKGIRQSSLEYAQEAAEASDVSRETISRRATLLAKVNKNVIVYLARTKSFMLVQVCRGARGPHPSQRKGVITQDRLRFAGANRKPGQSAPRLSALSPQYVSAFLPVDIRKPAGV